MTTQIYHWLNDWLMVQFPHRTAHVTRKIYIYTKVAATKYSTSILLSFFIQKKWKRSHILIFVSPCYLLSPSSSNPPMLLLLLLLSQPILWKKYVAKPPITTSVLRLFMPIHVPQKPIAMCWPMSYLARPTRAPPPLTTK